MADALEDGPAKQAPQTLKKKSLFGKSTWGAPAEQKDGIEFFSRAEELWPSRLLDDDRRRQKKATKLERKRSGASVERKIQNTQDIKRRRVSQNEEQEPHPSGDSTSHDDADEASWKRRRVVPLVIIIKF
jgi:hypothetical protein